MTWLNHIRMLRQSPALTKAIGLLGWLSIAGVVSFAFISRVRGDRIQQLPLPDPNSANVVFIFRPQDCQGDLTVINYWNLRHRSNELVVHGVLVDGPSSSPERSAFLAKSGVQFPTLNDPRAADAFMFLAKKLGHRITPVAFVFDREGRLLLVIPPNIPPHLFPLNRLVGTW